MPSIKKNLFYQSSYQLLIMLIPLILAPYTSRVLGAENIGVYSFTFSVATYFIFFAALGINHHGSRTVAAVRDDGEKLDKTFGELLFLQLCISCFVFVVYIIFLFFGAGELRLIFAFQAIAVLSAALDISWLFKGLEQFKLLVIRNAVIRIIMVACVFMFVKNEGDLWKYTLIIASGTFATQAVIWVFVRKFITFKGFSALTRSGVASHIKPLLVLFIPVLAASVHSIMAKIILGIMTMSADKAQLGFFSNSEKIILIPVGFITAFGAIMIPRIASLGGNESEQQRLTLVSMKYVMLLAFAMTFGIAAIAGGFAPLFFGEEFRDCGILITVLCLMVPFMAFSNVIAAQFLIPASKDKAYTAGTVAGAVLNITANLILIPHYQALGAAMSAVIAEAFRCVLFTLAARKHLPVLTYIKNSFFFISAGALMFLTVRYAGFLLGETVFSILVQVASGMVFYLGISAVWLYITKDKFFIDNMRRILRIKKLGA